MGHLELILLATTSYLGSLWVIERWRRARRKPSDVSLVELGRPHLRRALAPVLHELAAAEGQDSRGRELLAALEARDIAASRELGRGLAAGLSAPLAALLEAAIQLVAAGAARSSFGRYRAGVRALRASRRARSVGVEATYLEVLILLGFLSDALTEDVRLLQSRRLLRRVATSGAASGSASEDPLVQLASALRSAAGGQAAEAVAALARAFYHARDDRFVAALIMAAPFVEELSPSLREEARRALSETAVRAVH